ncbi:MULTISPECIES: pantoate kinase [unclassified Methanobrevibacter]|uniref:pantoate kinase n=1 Tax=unclassified Methanobrevibacter TaxID=2638681 RepID=UPI0025F72F54|nr:MULTISPECIES: pantoate kinase [unclassified Methanobrevibacter]MEE0943670.1 pantoate kinase [Methanobrevibacter sp.]
MNKSVFVPGHVTGFFNIENHEISLKNGSCGAGFLLSRGVKSTISPSDRLSIDVNQGDETVIEEVLKILEIDDTFKITQDIQLPIGAGFGTSAASAFSLTLAINEFLNLGYSQELCGQIAHMAEINLGAGLGDVIAQTGKGIVLRTKPGAPGIGEIESFRKDVFIAYKTFGTIKTSDIISDPHHREVLSQVGLKYLELFEKETTLENFLSFSNSFSIETELMSDEVRNLVDYFNSSEDILGSSMAMLGNTVFAFAYDEDAFKDLDIEDLHICELNNIGIVYD